MPKDRINADMLAATGWDIRALGEAQLRSLTAMQRCIEDYLKTGDPHAADEIRRHAGELEHRSPHVIEALRLIRETLSSVEGSTTATG